MVRTKEPVKKTLTRTKNPKGAGRKKDDPDRVYTLEELEDVLSEKQKMFCYEYISNGWVGTKAYLTVYGGTYNSAGVESCRMLKLSKIKQYISYVKEDFEKTCKISKAQMIRELRDLAMSDMSELYKDWMTLEEWEELKRERPEILKAIQEISTKTETKIGLDKEPIQVNYVKIKFHDKQRAIDQIFRAMGWNEPDKMNISLDQPLFPDVKY